MTNDLQFMRWQDVPDGMSVWGFDRHQNIACSGTKGGKMDLPYGDNLEELFYIPEPTHRQKFQKDIYDDTFSSIGFGDWPKKDILEDIPKILYRG